MTRNPIAPARRRAVDVTLWTLQGLLAALFAFAGAIKLIMPAAALTAQSHLPIALLRFVAVAELCGALGLVLPGVLRIRPALTPLAALGLLLVMIGAVTITAASQNAAAAAFPGIVGVLAGAVALGRRTWMRPEASRATRVAVA